MGDTGYLCKHCCHSDPHDLPNIGATGQPFGYCADCLGCRSHDAAQPAYPADPVQQSVPNPFGLTDAEQAELDNVFSYHQPIGDQVERYGVLRSEAGRLARLFVAYVPDSEERKQALFALRTAVMWANAGIACNEHG